MLWKIKFNLLKKLSQIGPSTYEFRRIWYKFLMTRVVLIISTIVEHMLFLNKYIFPFNNQNIEVNQSVKTIWVFVNVFHLQINV